MCPVAYRSRGSMTFSGIVKPFRKRCPCRPFTGSLALFGKGGCRDLNMGGTCGLRACLPLVSAIVPARVFRTVREQIWGRLVCVRLSRHFPY